MTICLENGRQFYPGWVNARDSSDQVGESQFGLNMVVDGRENSAE
jgi:hypothetical protein